MRHKRRQNSPARAHQNNLSGNTSGIFGGTTMFDKIAEIIASQLRADQADITEDTNVMEDLGADSLDVVEILMAIEENFGVSVSDDEIPNLKTVRDIVEYVESNM